MEGTINGSSPTNIRAATTHVMRHAFPRAYFGVTSRVARVTRSRRVSNDRRGCNTMQRRRMNAEDRGVSDFHGRPRTYHRHGRYEDRARVEGRGGGSRPAARTKGSALRGIYGTTTIDATFQTCPRNIPRYSNTFVAAKSPFWDFSLIFVLCRCIREFSRVLL